MNTNKPIRKDPNDTYIRIGGSCSLILLCKLSCDLSLKDDKRVKYTDVIKAEVLELKLKVISLEITFCNMLRLTGDICFKDHYLLQFDKNVIYEYHCTERTLLGT